MSPMILARRPSPRLAAGELTHLERVEVDPELALEQWRGVLHDEGPRRRAGREPAL